MAENGGFIHKNPKLPDSVLKRLKKFEEKKQENNPPEKPNIVTVPVPEVVPPPLKAECKPPGKFSHPAIRWPLYALGGFLIMKWAWSKWKPKDDKSKPKDDKSEK